MNDVRLIRHICHPLSFPCRCVIPSSIRVSKLVCAIWPFAQLELWEIVHHLKITVTIHCLVENKEWLFRFCILLLIIFASKIVRYCYNSLLVIKLRHEVITLNYCCIYRISCYNLYKCIKNTLETDSLNSCKSVRNPKSVIMVIHFHIRHIYLSLIE